MATTDHYGLKRLQSGDDISDDSFKFGDADRVLEDTLLFLGAEGHHHTGGVPATTGPTSAPTLTLDTTQGSIPAGTRVYYEYTYVDGNGIETAASPSAFIDTPAQIGSPSAPTISYTTTGGTLLPGSYFYVLSAYTTFNNHETLAANPVFVTVPFTTNTNEITLTLPSLPTGADGFNVYRKSPTSTNYRWIAAIDMQVATPPSEFVDNGTYAEDCDRLLPAANTAQSTNAVTITLPGATPFLPVGYQWRIYRTYVSGTWTNSVLVTTGALLYLDLGVTTTVGQPPSSDVGVGTPSRVLLTGAAEVQGLLPVGNVEGFPFTISFSQEGTVTVGQGAQVWLAPFNGVIKSCRIALGRGSTPVSQAVIVDVNKGPAVSGNPPTYTTIFTTQANRPKVNPGSQIGAVATPDVTTFLTGDVITFDVDQAGGSATPTDHELTVHVYVWANP